MKTKSKALLLALCAVMLVAASVFGTLAYMTDTHEVTNTFNVGNVTTTLDEALVNENGELLDANGDVYDPNGTVPLAERVTTNEYHLVPARNYVKDPTVHVDPASDNAYLFVKILVKDNTDLETALAKHGLDTEAFVSVINGLDNAAWTITSTKNTDGSKEYFLTHNTIVEASQDIVVFTDFTVPSQFDNADLKAIEDLEIVITSYAVQVDGFATAAAAWAATFGA